MNVLGAIIFSSGEIVTDDDGNVVTHSWLLPETPEIIWGGLASLIVFFLLWKYGWPQAKAAFAARTQRVQDELDSAAADRATAAQEAVQIRTAKGDIEAERARILAEAEMQAASIVSEGRSRLQTELAELTVKAEADIAAATNRVGDELRSEIARLSIAAVDHVVTGSLDEATHQQLIEDFIARVGAGR